MSITAIRNVLYKSKARGLSRIVLIILAEHCNEKNGDGICWPSVARIAELAGTQTDKSSVRRVLRKLERAGEIETIRGGGRGYVNMYKLNAKYLNSPEQKEKGDTMSSFPEKGDNFAQKRGHYVPLNQNITKNKIEPEESEKVAVAANYEPQPARSDDRAGVASATPQRNETHERVLSFNQIYYALAYITSTNPNDSTKSPLLAEVARVIADRNYTHAMLYREFDGLRLADVANKLGVKIHVTM